MSYDRGELAYFDSDTKGSFSYEDNENDKEKTTQGLNRKGASGKSKYIDRRVGHYFMRINYKRIIRKYNELHIQVNI